MTAETDLGSSALFLDDRAEMGKSRDLPKLNWGVRVRRRFGLRTPVLPSHLTLPLVNPGGSLEDPLALYELGHIRISTEEG